MNWNMWLRLFAPLNRAGTRVKEADVILALAAFLIPGGLGMNIFFWI